MHRSCYEMARPAKAAKPKSQMEALLDDVAAPAAPETKPCVNCGMPKAIDAVACTACRFDESLGRVPKEPKAPKAKKQKTLASAGSISGAIVEPEKEGLAATAWARAAVGASIAGAVCALIWGGFTYWTGWELPIAALGVGFVVGCGSVIGVRSHAGFMSGLIAGVVTLASVFGGKFLAASWYVGDFLEAMSPAMNSVYMQPLDHTRGWMTDEQAVAWMVNHEVIKKEYMGVDLAWPDAVDDEANATELDWYPQDIVERVRRDWAEKTAEERTLAKIELANEIGMGMTANDAVPAFEGRGVTLEYPRQHTYETAYFVKDYPMEVQSAAEMRWFNMTPEKQCEYVNDRIAIASFDSGDQAQAAWQMMIDSERPENYDTVANLTGVESSAMRGMKGWVWGMIWLGGSFFVAWGVGCGGKN
ncbi:MAG: hypothetical protein AAF937_06280, partial [Planctomycetota bacterium]